MSKFICEKCKSKLQKLERSIDGDKINLNINYEQYLCEDCYNEIWESLFNQNCPICYSKRCEKGIDCWINPWPNIMYLCYVAPKALSG